jgi:hypothetical protein
VLHAQPLSDPKPPRVIGLDDLTLPHFYRQ